MRVLIVSCAAIGREIAALLPAGGDSRVVLLDMAYHQKPRRLRHRLQEIIDRETGVDAVLVLYGYCGGTLHLEPRGAPVVVPKANDCFDLLLGQEERFALFSEEPGTYFLSEGWVRNDGTPAEKQRELLERWGCGRDIAASVYAGYRRLCFVRTGVETEGSIRRAKQSAIDLDWTFTERRAGLTLMNKALAGTWDDDFIVMRKRTRTAAAS